MDGAPGKPRSILGLAYSCKKTNYTLLCGSQNQYWIGRGLIVQVFHHYCLVRIFVSCPPAILSGSPFCTPRSAQGTLSCGFWGEVSTCGAPWSSCRTDCSGSSSPGHAPGKRIFLRHTTVFLHCVMRFLLICSVQKKDHWGINSMTMAKSTELAYIGNHRVSS